MAGFRMKTVSVEMLFDRKKVIRAGERANRRNLAKAGAFVLVQRELGAGTVRLSN